MATPPPAANQTHHENGDFVAVVFTSSSAVSPSIPRQEPQVTASPPPESSENRNLPKMSDPDPKKEPEAPVPIASESKMDDVAQQPDSAAERRPKLPEEVPHKRRKTRRGKSKRKHPYTKTASDRTTKKVIIPEAPHNSNQFLLEDHGGIEELDENLKCGDQVSTSTVTRTRDSSFSVDSDCEFYSSPDDEEQFLIKDFDDQYKSVQAERLASMSKTELIQEYLILEHKVDDLSKRLQKCEEEEEEDLGQPELQGEIERLMIENERLRRENESLKTKLLGGASSEDSETDSSDSCSSSTSSSSGNASANGLGSPTINCLDYIATNGHTSPIPNDPV